MCNKKKKNAESRQKESCDPRSQNQAVGIVNTSDETAFIRDDVFSFSTGRGTSEQQEGLADPSRSSAR